METAELHRPTADDGDDSGLDISNGGIRIRTGSGIDKLKEFLRKKYFVYVVIVALVAFICFIGILTRKPEIHPPSEPEAQPAKRKPINMEELLYYQGSPLPSDFFLQCPANSLVPPKSDNCRWIFDRYESSEYEHQWISNIKEWESELCTKLAQPEHLKNSQVIIELAQSLKNGDTNTIWRNTDSFPTGKLKEDYGLMSRFHYRRECYNETTKIWDKAIGKAVELIEPLWGYLRDPFEGQCPSISNKFLGWKGNPGESKEHIIPVGAAPYAYTIKDNEILPNQWRTQGIPPWRKNAIPDQHYEKSSISGRYRERIALDFGTSSFNNSQNGNNAIAPSIKWLYAIYNGHGVKFDNFIQVVSKKLDVSLIWEQLPDDLRYAYALINSPINMEDDNNLNMLRLIKIYVKPDDFFVLKVNIDQQDVEDEFASALKENNEVATLVDELYFQHKVNINIMSQVWGEDLDQNLADSYDLFVMLRKNGIRSHSSP